MKKILIKTFAAITIGLLLIADSVSGQIATGGSYRLDQSVTANGGGTSTGSGYKVEGTAGQSATDDSLMGSPYSVKSGFWPAALLAPTVTSASVSGTILDSNSNPVAGAVIRLSGTQNRKTITDANGYYRFDNVETNGFYTVTPSRVNYNFSPSQHSFSQLGTNTDAGFSASLTSDTAWNPLDTPEFFVRQQYLDFLNREPDPEGFNYWTSELDSCQGDPQCLSRTRINVSAAFFIEREFQDSGLFIYDLYKGAMGRQPEFAEYSLDRRRVRGGSTLEADRAAFTESFVERAEFLQQYPSSMTADVFVDALLRTAEQSSQIELSSRRASLVTIYQSGSNVTQSRVLVLLSVVESDSFRNAQYNSAFVLMQYFGYLRRDADIAGYLFWLGQLNGTPRQGTSKQDAMICSFITSAEYQQRFGALLSHSNAECLR